MMPYHRFILSLCSLFLFTSLAVGQTSGQPDRFNLVLFGSNLDAGSTRLWLKENPGIEDHWQQLTSTESFSGDNDDFSTLIVSGLSTERFAGQDIRENYIALKIAGGENTELRAVYVLPATGENINKVGKILHSHIQAHPMKVRQYSIASQVRPRPVKLSDSSEFIEHIQMPVQHLKAGVQEVKWLDIIFSQE